MSRRGLVLFVALCIIWGLPYLLIKVAVREVDPGTLVFLRTAPVAVVMVPWVVATRGVAALRTKAGWVAAYALVEFGVPWLLMTKAEQHLSSSLTALLVASVPMVAAFLYRFTHIHEPLGATRLVGLLLGAGGVALLVGLSLGGSNTIGIVQMSGVILGYSIGPLIIATKLSELPGTGVVAASVALVALLYAPFGLTHLPSHVSAETVAAIAVLALVCTAAAFLVFFALIVEVGPARSTVVTYVNPAVAVLLGIVLLGEHVTPAMLLGFPLIIIGSWLATQRSTPADGEPVAAIDP